MRTLWKYQHADGLTVETGKATDSIGLKLRRSCGFAWVCMGDRGWLQMSIAIRKLEHEEAMARIECAR